MTRKRQAESWRERTRKRKRKGDGHVKRKGTKEEGAGDDAE